MGLAWATLLMGCDGGESCCNSCGRNFYLGSGSGAGGTIWISNIQDGGNECEIDDIPPSFPMGVSTLVGTLNEDRMDVEDHAAGDRRADLCEGVDVFDAEQARAAGLPPGTRACIVDEVDSETACTQKGCAAGLSCTVHAR